MGLRMKNFNTLIFCGFTDKSNFSGGGGSRKPNKEEGWPKKGAWAVSRFKGVGLGKKDGGVILRGGGMSQCKLWKWNSFQTITYCFIKAYAFFLRFFINSYLCEKLLRHDFLKQMLVQNELIFNEINEMNEAWIWQYIFLGERGVSHDVDVILERVVT